MANPLKMLTTTVGKKFLMGATGLMLIGFLFVHLGGNLLLLVPDKGNLFNQYAHHLVSLGPALWLAEAVLAAIFLGHIAMGVSVTMRNKTARGVAYRDEKTKGGPSQKTVASLSMIYSGVILAIFLVVHIVTFKFGTYYETTIHGETVRDLYKLVVESFQHPLYTLFYVVSLGLLGLHLRHGFWSAFQSLGAAHPTYTKCIQATGIGIACLMAFGFIAIPVIIFIVY